MAKAKTKTVVLLVDHVFMPEDLARPDWETSDENKKYPATVGNVRVKYEVHEGLADMMIQKNQAVDVSGPAQES